MSEDYNISNTERLQKWTIYTVHSIARVLGQPNIRRYNNTLSGFKTKS